MEGCVEAKGSVTSAGHIIWWRDKQNVYAHRYTYEQEVGPIPEGLIVRHKCDNPPCINVEHLELGTHADNSNDRSRRNRHHAKRLSDEDVVKIKAALEHPYKGINRDLAAQYSVDPSHISHIRRGRDRKRG